MTDDYILIEVSDDGTETYLHPPPAPINPPSASTADNYILIEVSNDGSEMYLAHPSAPLNQPISNDEIDENAVDDLLKR